MAEQRIACATDETYAPYCAAMLQALLQQHPGGITVHLLHASGFAPRTLTALQRLVERCNGRW